MWFRYLALLQVSEQTALEEMASVKATAEVVPPARTYGGRFDGTEDCTGSCIGSTCWRMTSPGWDPFAGWMIVNVSFLVIFIGLFMFKRFLDRHYEGWRGMFKFPHNFSGMHNIMSWMCTVTCTFTCAFTSMYHQWL